MKHLPIFSFFILILLLPSCDKNSSDSAKFIAFDLEAGINHPEAFAMSDIVSSISYIPLETEQESLIGKIHIIVIADDKFLLNTRNKEIKVFSEEGTFSHDIGRIGKGPGEYSDARNLSWDSDSKEVLIYNIGNTSLQFYSLAGNFKRNLKVPHNPMFVYPLQNGKYIGSLLFETQLDSLYGKVFQFDTTGTVIGYGKAKMAEQQVPSIMVSPSFFKMGTKDLFIPGRSDTVFQISDGNIIPLVSLGLGNLMIPDEIYYSKGVSSVEKAKYIYILLGYELNENEFAVEFRKGKHYYMAICNIKTGKSQVMKIDQSGIVNDIDGGLPLDGLYYSTTQDGYLYRYVDPINLITDLEEGILKDPSAELQATINLLDQEDNPVIIKMKIRERVLK